MHDTCCVKNEKFYYSPLIIEVVCFLITLCEQRELHDCMWRVMWTGRCMVTWRWLQGMQWFHSNCSFDWRDWKQIWRPTVAHLLRSSQIESWECYRVLWSFSWLFSIHTTISKEVLEESFNKSITNTLRTKTTFWISHKHGACAADDTHQTSK